MEALVKRKKGKKKTNYTIPAIVGGAVILVLAVATNVFATPTNGGGGGGGGGNVVPSGTIEITVQKASLW